jgi:hypothetical protein
MAPDVTTTTRRPVDRTAVTSEASRSMAEGSTPPDPVVTDEDPIFTTTVPEVTPWPPGVVPLTIDGAGRRRRP